MRCVVFCVSALFCVLVLCACCVRVCVIYSTYIMVSSSYVFNLTTDGDITWRVTLDSPNLISATTVKNGTYIACADDTDSGNET